MDRLMLEMDICNNRKCFLWLKIDYYGMEVWKAATVIVDYKDCQVARLKCENVVDSYWN